MKSIVPVVMAGVLGIYGLIGMAVGIVGDAGVRCVSLPINILFLWYVDCASGHFDFYY